MGLTEGKLEKLNFVNELSKVICKVQKNITEIRYEVFESVAGCLQEWLTIAYDGGAMTNISVYGNSCSAILEEIAKYTRHGNYSFNNSYLDCVNSSDWRKIS